VACYSKPIVQRGVEASVGDAVRFEGADMSEIKIDPISKDFGARVTNIDLTQSLSDDLVSALVAAIDRYGVLVFPGRPVSQEQQVAFTKNFGPLDYGPQKALKTIQVRLEEEALSDISNVDAEGKIADRSNAQSIMNVGNMLWHSDSSYAHYPFRYSVLACQIPSQWGGQTEFADLRGAYDTLDPNLLAVIEGKTGWFFSIHGRDQLGVPSSDEIRAMWPPVQWPLIRTHKPTGRKLLWVGTPLYEIDGMPTHEARMLARALLEHATQREHVYSHQWHADDVVMWDNRVTLHRGRWFDLGERREMRRAGTTDDIGSLDAPIMEKPAYAKYASG
jgi:alpha-ketoglutarate-dependent 2,4-dichlorophenoxyacetate dioxygenase